MGAFFSGTDNNDDRGAIGFSGVFGNLDKAEPGTVWRFNYYDRKFEAKLTDIFETPQHPSIEIPDEWIEQVKVGYGGGFFGVRQNSTDRHIIDQRSKTGSRGTHLALTGPEEELLAAEGHSPKKAKSSVSQESRAGGANAESGYQGEFLGEFWSMVGLGRRDGDGIPGGDLTEADIDRLMAHSERTMSGNGVNLISLEGETEVDPVGSGNDDCPYLDADRYNELACNYGPKVAIAFCEIQERIVDLEDKDDLLKDVMIDALGLMSAEQQSKMFREVYDNLPQQEKNRIAQNGL